MDYDVSLNKSNLSDFPEDNDSKVQDKNQYKKINNIEDLSK